MNLTPLLRLFDYSELNANSIEEMLIPPALFSLTLNKISDNVSITDEKISVNKTFNIKLTSVATVFQEEDLSKFLNEIKNIVENPLNISL